MISKFSYRIIIGIFSMSTIGLLISQHYLMNIPTHTNWESISTHSLSAQQISPVCFQEPKIDFFMYHYIREKDPNDAKSTEDLSVDPTDFRKHMSYIREQADQKNITLMKGEEFLNSIHSGCFPGKHIWIFTSDDGWSDTFTNLVPIAQEYGVPFFLGIITNRIDMPGFVTKNQIIQISKNPLFTISSHSIHHLEEDTMIIQDEETEICESKKVLENIIEIPVLSYIYPVGHMSKNSAIITQKCNYTVAWSTGFGSKWDSKNPSLFDINRIRIHHNTTIEIFKTHIQP